MPEQQEDEVTRNLDVRGSLSTKVESVVKTLLKIQRLDPTAKSLVFSTWNGILDIIGEALDENEIHHASLATTGGKNFKRNLQKFKVYFYTLVKCCSSNVTKGSKWFSFRTGMMSRYC